MRVQLGLFSEPMVQKISKEDILARMKTYIENKILNKTEVHYRMFLRRKHRLSPDSYIKNKFDLIFTPWSSSACYLEVYEDYGDQISTKDYLNEVERRGAQTVRVWEAFVNNPELKPLDIINKFMVRENIRDLIYANGTKEECDEIAELIIQWNLHCLPTYDMTTIEKIPELEFMRKSNPKKGELTSTRCMNGECIGGILTRETAF